MYDVLIIGAGPAGLTTAYKLLQADPSKKLLILEQDARYVGGISRTVEYKGYHFDIGGHRFFSRSQEIVDLWNEILPDDFIDCPRLSRIYYRKRFFSYPLKAFEAFIKLGPLTSGLCILSYIRARLFPVPVRSFHDWVRNNFGERLFCIFFKTYTEKVWGMNCDDISADWAAQRIKGLHLSAAILNAFKNSLRLTGKNDGNIKTLISSFRYPRLGPGMMWDAAAAKIRAFGGEIRMGSTVQGLEKKSDGWTVRTFENGAVQEYDACHVVSSAPLRDIVQAITPLPGCAAQAVKLQYRDFITVAVMMNRESSFDDNWIYIHDPAVKVGRVQNFTSWSPAMVPRKGLSCLGLEYFCFEHDDLWDSADTDLIALAKRELMHIGLARESDFLDASVVRQRKAYPVYDRDYKTILDAISTELLANYPTLHLVGRNGMHKYNNQDHAMMTGILTAENIMAGKILHDVRIVNEDAEYHEKGETSAGRRHALRSVHQIPVQG